MAALVASTTTYAATGLINGARIKNHTIAAKKLSRKAVRQLHHGNDDKIDTYSSGPDAALTAWSTKVTNGGHSSATVHAYAICVSS